MPFFSAIKYGELNTITDTIQARFVDAGHIMGSASIELFVTENEKPARQGGTKKLVFSGDIGQRNTPIVQDPTLIQEADYLFMESTYGDRMHEDSASKEEMLLKYANETFAK
jgi:metallo-beta-lactamase family protein